MGGRFDGFDRPWVLAASTMLKNDEVLCAVPSSTVSEVFFCFWKRPEEEKKVGMRVLEHTSNGGGLEHFIIHQKRVG